MKRSKFIAALVAITAAPSVWHSQTKSKLNQPGKGFKVASGKDRFDKSISLFGKGEGTLLMFFQPAGKLEEYFQLMSK